MTFGGGMQAEVATCARPVGMLSDRSPLEMGVDGSAGGFAASEDLGVLPCQLAKQVSDFRMISFKERDGVQDVIDRWCLHVEFSPCRSWARMPRPRDQPRLLARSASISWACVTARWACSIDAMMVRTWGSV